MGLKIFTPPLEEPVSIAEARLQVRKVTNEEDRLIASWIASARLMVERFTGLKLLTQTWDCIFDAFPDCRETFEFPIGPLQTLTSVTWYADGDVPTVLDPSLYSVDAISVRARIALRYGQVWPTARLRAVNGVVARGVFGFGDDAAAVTAAAEPLRTAMLLLVGHFAENREATSMTRIDEVPLGARELIRLYSPEVLA